MEEASINSGEPRVLVLSSIGIPVSLCSPKFPYSIFRLLARRFSHLSQYFDEGIFEGDKIDLRMILESNYGDAVPRYVLRERSPLVVVSRPGLECVTGSFFRSHFKDITSEWSVWLESLWVVFGGKNDCESQSR